MPLLETDRLTKQYPGVTALAELSLSVEPGIIGLVGANGAGKSTLIKILLGLIPSTSGRANLLGYDVQTQGLELRQYVGYMPEHDCLPTDVSATDFVSHMARINGLPKTAAKERTAETLRHVALFEERYREIGGYSTGMKQRVKLAQALVHDPRVMLLDEPTNGLDPAGRDEMLDLVQRTGHEFGISIFMSSHLLGEIERVCDHLIIIEDGRLLRSDTVEAFTRRTETLTVEVDGSAEDLARRLEEAGFRVAVEGATVLIAGGEEMYDAVRDSAVALNLGLIRMEHRRQQLEDLFRTEPAEGEAVRA